MNIVIQTMGSLYAQFYYITYLWLLQWGMGGMLPTPPLYQNDLTNSMPTEFEFQIIKPSLVYIFNNEWKIKGVIIQEYYQ